MTSVVVPVYNGASVLPTTVPAVLGLVGVDEVVWVNDGSTDGTADVLRQVVAGHERASVVTFAENRGRAAARNAGAEATTGPVVVFFDADVEPPSPAARSLADAATAAGCVAAVARLDHVATDPAEPFQDYVARHARGPSPSRAPGDRLDWRFFLSGACAVRRDALLAAGGFPEDVAYGEDVALACRLASEHPNGLRLADATVRLHDLGDLERALRNAAAFGVAAARFGEDCPSGALDRFRRAGVVGPLASVAAPALRAVVGALGPGPVRRRAVRYLLASTALRAARRA
ncbi:glycosyltransferase [Rubrivirga sp.]|uniref:glycosyltransferase n=1 Tax=Rubrivirga sp. TaxID=1885344 RepID=UPI003B526E3F